MVTLTDAATRKAAELLTTEADPDMMLRVAVRPGGCSGFSYEMYFDNDVNPGDTQTTFTADASTVTVVIDPDSQLLLDGATLDYRNDLNRSGFTFTNPAANRTCGCGQSFS